jgi:hypothetical protein
MNAETRVEAAPLAKLREPFAPNHISKLPKETRAQIDARKASDGRSVMVFNCKVCGGHHHKDAVHLDYVGHAALTDRLLDTDIEWSWEPVGFTPEGLPAHDRNGGLWIKLTVCGVTRYGYGAADGKTGGDAVKEIIGDALRNAAMRFGAALDLWHKGELHPESDVNPTTGEQPAPKRGEGERKPGENFVAFEKLEGPYSSGSGYRGAIKAFVETLSRMQDLGEFTAWMATPEVVELEKYALKYLPGWWETGEGCSPDFVPVAVRIHQKKRDLEELENIHENSGVKYVNAG